MVAKKLFVNKIVGATQLVVMVNEFSYNPKKPSILISSSDIEEIVVDNTDFNSIEELKIMKDLIEEFIIKYEQEFGEIE